MNISHCADYNSDQPLSYLNDVVLYHCSLLSLATPPSDKSHQHSVYFFYPQSECKGKKSSFLVFCLFLYAKDTRKILIFVLIN